MGYLYWGCGRYSGTERAAERVVSGDGEVYKEGGRCVYNRIYS